MKQPKPHSDTNEMLLLIKIRRDAARAAMTQIVKDISTPPHTIPSVSLLGDYLLNMVFCLELMLKVLANKWTNHDVITMYNDVFGRPHPVPELLMALKSAICDQKYLYEPACGLADFLPDVEELYDELKAELGLSHQSSFVKKNVAVPSRFAAYIRDNPGRFAPVQCILPEETDKSSDEPGSRATQRYHEFVSGVRESFGQIAASGEDFEFATQQFYVVNPPTT